MWDFYYREGNVNGKVEEASTGCFGQDVFCGQGGHCHRRAFAHRRGAAMDRRRYDHKPCFIRETASDDPSLLYPTAQGAAVNMTGCQQGRWQRHTLSCE
jgi:hypothetical protein